MKKKAVFLDRDGTIIKLVYNTQSESIDSVSRTGDIEITYDFPEVLKQLQSFGYLLILVSNQPRIGLKKETKENFDSIRNELNRQLEEQGIKFDKEYYCFHHPFAQLAEYKQNCDCRKPGIKSFQDAQKEFDIDMDSSWMIGDSASDILAGRSAGVKTILMGNIVEGAYLAIIEEQMNGEKPDFFIKKPKEILEIIKS